MNRLDEIAKEIAHCFDYEEEWLRDRLIQELFETGYNVKQAVKHFGITPHQYDEKMEEFYKNSDAFVFESIIDNERPYRKLISDRIVKEIEKQFGSSKDIEILDLGGGVGTDCINIAINGYKNITYFEFEGPSCKFAKYRFNKHGVASSIKIINELYKIPKNCFDVVISVEVLEHVEDPKRTVKELHSYLKKGGIAIITEGFSKIEPNFPTHLKSNLRFSGRTIVLFESQGLTLVDGYLDLRPLVFAKGLGLKKKIVCYFSKKLFVIRLKTVHQRIKQIVKRYILT